MRSSIGFDLGLKQQEGREGHLAGAVALRTRAARGVAARSHGHARPPPVAAGRRRHAVRRVLDRRPDRDHADGVRRRQQRRALGTRRHLAQRRQRRAARHRVASVPRHAAGGLRAADALWRRRRSRRDDPRHARTARSVGHAHRQQRPGRARQLSRSCRRSSRMPARCSTSTRGSISRPASGSPRSASCRSAC